MIRRLFSGGAISRRWLLSPAQFAEALSDIENPMLLEVGGSHSSLFERARIAGARPLPVNAFIPPSLKHIEETDVKNGGGVKPGAGMIQPAKFEWMMSVLGVSNPDDAIFLYDDTGMLGATRAWWVLQCYGHQNVYLLNGGWKAWINDHEDGSAPRKIEAGPPTIDVSKTHYQARYDPSKTVTLDEMLNLVGRNEVQMVDARPWEEFIGKNSRGNKHVGHVPDARFFDLSKILLKGTIQDPESATVHEAIEHSSLKPSKLTVVYCHSAIRVRMADFYDFAF
jgi:3-mercaptopyruvate sulfurtransferase SseA